jgi:hypothetical protein
MGEQETSVDNESLPIHILIDGKADHGLRPRPDPAVQPEYLSSP